MNGAARPPFGEAFWQPFLARASTFASRLTDGGDGFQEGDVIEEISMLLASVDKRLAPILEIDGAGTIQFVVTANGNRGAFPVAGRLVRAAPSLAPWRFVALKPRAAIALQRAVTLPSGQALRLEDIRVAMVPSRRGVEIALLMPVDASDPEAATRCRPLARSIVLDLLGEEDLASLVIDVEVFPVSALQPNSST